MAGPAAAQEPGRVVGRVTDGAGNPVKGAAVELVADAGGARATATSGETGGFEFAGVAAGAYTLRAEGAGFSAHTSRVTVGAGERRTVIARLRPARMARQ
jgi:protocatechuate 3,4-dioxygenase beta subunit